MAGLHNWPAVSLLESMMDGPLCPRGRGPKGEILFCIFTVRICIIDIPQEDDFTFVRLYPQGATKVYTLVEAVAQSQIVEKN